MARTVAALALLLAAANARAWGHSSLRGNGEKVTEARQVPAFHSVRLESALDLSVVLGGPPSVAVTIDSNLQPEVETRVEGDTLVIATRRSISWHGQGKVSVTAPELAGLILSGSGDAIVTGAAGGDAELSIRGSGAVRWTGAARRLLLRIEGSGDAVLFGRAEVLEIEVAGSGRARAADLAARDARVRVAGSGDVQVRLSGGALDAEVSGSGDVRWTGEGWVKRAQVSGSGAIARR